MTGEFPHGESDNELSYLAFDIIHTKSKYDLWYSEMLVLNNE